MDDIILSKAGGRVPLVKDGHLARLANLDAPTDDNDAVRKAYADSLDAANSVTDQAYADALDATAVHVTGNETVAGVKTFSSALLTGVTAGVAGTNVVAVENGDGVNFLTTLTLTAVVLGAPGAGTNEAVGALIYTLPAGVQLHSVTYHSVGLTIGTVTTDTPDMGIGSVIATGAVAVLGGTPTFEDYVTGLATADCAGTASVVGPVGATAGIHTGISLNKAADVKAIHLNAADGWNAGVTGNLTATGTIVLKWTKIA